MLLCGAWSQTMRNCPQGHKIRTEEVFVATTVFLETEWALRSAFGFSPGQIVKSLRAFVGLPGVHVENAGRLRNALDWASSGLDFADALHLASADGCDALVTFDKVFVKAAKAGSPREVRPL